MPTKELRRDKKMTSFSQAYQECPEALKGSCFNVLAFKHLILEMNPIDTSLTNPAYPILLYTLNLKFVTLRSSLGGLARFRLNVQGEEENNWDEGPEENSKVSSNGNVHAALSKEHGLVGGLRKRHGHGGLGSAGSTACSGKLVARAERSLLPESSEGWSGGEGGGGSNGCGNEESETLHGRRARGGSFGPLGFRGWGEWGPLPLISPKYPRFP